MAAIVGGCRSQGGGGGRARAGPGGPMSRGVARVPERPAGGGGGGNASTTVGTVGGARRGVVNGDARRSNGVAIVGGRGYAERVVKTSVKPHAMARSPKTSARRDGEREREWGPERRRRPRLGLKIPSLSVGYPWKRRPSRWGGISPTTTVLSVKLIYDCTGTEQGVRVHRIRRRRGRR